MRHVTTMNSPTVPNYVTTARYPVEHITQLRTDPTFENIVAHQSYLEKLQFEQNCVRSWSNMIQDQIMGEADQVHNQMARMILTMQQQQQQQSTNPWTRGYAEPQMQSNQGAPPPRPVQPTAQPAPIQVKPAPARHQAQPSSSSMNGAPVNAPFPPQMGADPWMQGRERQQ